MSHDEPLTIARRLATRLDAPLHRWPEGGDVSADVLLVAADRLDEVPDDRLATAVAALVVGDPAAATSAALIALRERVEQRGAAVALSTFATVADAHAGVGEVPLVIAAPSRDPRVAPLLAAGQHSLLLDPAVDTSSVSGDDEPARVCVVSFEVSGMTGGGIGTASTSLAETLARSGHDVTLLFTGWQEADAAESHARWQHHYAERGVRLEIIREPATNTVKNPHFPARSAYEVYCWLRREAPFDVVHLPENLGHGAYAQLAKRQGAHFADTTFVVGTHGPTRWAAEANRVALTREEFLANDALERLSVELADVLLGPSRYLHDYKRVRGWRLPERVAVQAYSLPTAVRGVQRGADAPTSSSDGGLPREIVFFGRLETRKGVATLCDALDLLAAGDDSPAVEVTFLGPVASVLGEPADVYIERRAAAWPWRWRIVSDRDQQGAAEYLSRPGVLAVMPSTVDNAPNTVSEAVALGIPLIAGRAGGTGELVAAEQRDDHMFGAAPGVPLPPSTLDKVVPSPDPRPLAELLRRRLTTHVEPARTPETSEAVDEAYDRWHRAVRRARRSRTPEVPVTELPRLAACVLFDGDEPLLADQLDALRAADAEIELVVADLRADADAPVAAAQERSVAVVRPTRGGHAAEARTAAVEATTAELLAIVPPADVPLEGFAARLRQAAAATGADVYGCPVLDARADEPTSTPEEAMKRAFVPLFGPPLAGLTHPAFAAGPYAIRRAALSRLGGFSPDARRDEADHELLNRAATAGLAIEVVPEPLAEKRRDDRWSRFRAEWPHHLVVPPYDAEQWLRVERPFAPAGSMQADLVGLLRGARGEAVGNQARLLEQHDAYEERVAEQQGWIDGLETRAAEQRGYQAELEAEVQRLTGEVDRLRRLAEEMEQSAAQLTVRTLRNAGKKLGQRVKR